ncbi:hypothetical protein LTR78_010172 [Recurvomyces mirabilis]|uniref:Uncharacterized protein n=1 Tax=Recurvomyces mirabilis TaxID=574656 RepID=A0AAE0WF58_9PEZI|nr:hypothetical protein LTR78_010172 [Recurvomyces mirabilis]KAK5149701.1 hypothetical protein LTS14_010699 [Recurvomyces mirabilis]
MAGICPIPAHQQDKIINQEINISIRATIEEIENVHRLAMSRLVSSASQKDRDLRVLAGHLCTVDYLEQNLAERRKNEFFSSPAKLPRTPRCNSKSLYTLPSTLVTVECIEVKDDSMDVSKEAANIYPELTDASRESDSDDAEHYRDENDDDENDDDENDDDENDDDWERLSLTRTVSYRATAPIVSESIGENLPIYTVRET